MKENGYEYVDLGLPSGTMWATCNVGASKQEDEGLLFQFGHADGYKYGDKNHKFRKNVQNLLDGSSSEYTPITTSGKIYKANDILDLADDAAHVNMGGAWKMPTKDELEELVNNTTQEVETINGVKGMLFASNINKRQLFIPFMQGYWYNGTWYSLNKSYINMWTSQVHDSHINNAYELWCNASGYVDVWHDGRTFTFSVRGVFNINEHKNNVEHTNNVEYADNINMLI